MDFVTRELIIIYKPLDLDWLNFKITRENPITYHHIDKREFGGKKTIDNGALLTRTSHQYLHLIESKEDKLYYAINQLLKLINKQKTPPTQEQRQIMDFLLDEFYKAHEHDKNAKGEPLIKEKYLKRY
jgi:hypothetical protein